MRLLHREHIPPPLAPLPPPSDMQSHPWDPGAAAQPSSLVSCTHVGASPLRQNRI